MMAWLKHIVRSRYVAMLEEDVARLRAENRALVNSLLGTAGFPPVDFPEAKPHVTEISRPRRRSWHQIQTLRETEARRSHPDPFETAHDAEPMADERFNGPVPHN